MHFDETLQAIDELEIAYPHVFAYSARPGTPAARIPSQLSKAERKDRARKARDVGRLVWQRVAQRQVGLKTRVLVESAGSDADSLTLKGRASNYFPVIVDCDKGELGGAKLPEEEVPSLNHLNRGLMCRLPLFQTTL